MANRTLLVGCHSITLRRAVLAAVASTMACSALAACGAAPVGTTTPTETTSSARSTATATAAEAGPRSWTVVTTVPAQTTDMVFALSNPQIVYLCADDGPAAPPVQQTPRLHKSTDGGRTWNLVTAAPPLQPVPASVSGPTPLARCDVFVDAADANDVFLQQVELEPVGASFAVLRTLYRSRDGGATWTALGTIDKSDGFTALYVVSGRLVGIYKPSVYGASQCDNSITPRPGSWVVASDDGGATWHDTATSIESQGYSAAMLAVAGTTLIVAGSHVPTSACTYSTQSAIWRSTDGGRTWSSAKTLAAAYLGNLAFAPSGGGRAYYGVVVATPKPNISNQVLYATADGGVTWTEVPFGGTELGGSALVPLANGDVLTQGAAATIYRLRLSDPHPSWAAVAPGADGTWQVVTANGATILWAVAYTYGGQSTVEYLTLPQ